MDNHDREIDNLEIQKKTAESLAQQTSDYAKKEAYLRLAASLGKIILEKRSNKIVE